MSNIEVTIVMYILVIITSIIIYGTMTRILYKNRMANVLNLKGLLGKLISVR